MHVQYILFTGSPCILSEGSVMDQGVLAQLTQLYVTMKLECPFYRVCIYCMLHIHINMASKNTFNI